MFLSRAGLDLTSVARVMNNKLSQVIIEHTRNSFGGARIDKNKRGTRQAIATLRRGGMLGILFDQKFNNGIIARLMGHDAMTAPGPAVLSMQFDCPVIPVRIERIHGTKFRISCYPAVEAPRTDDKDQDVQVLTQRLKRCAGAMDPGTTGTVALAPPALAGCRLWPGRGSARPRIHRLMPEV